MLRVYGYYKYLYSYSAGSDFSHQNLTNIISPRCKGQTTCMLLLD